MSDDTASKEVILDTFTGSQPGVTIIKVSGPLNIRNFFDFQDMTRRQTAPVLLIDLTDVPYLDSAALGSMLGLHVSCGRTNRKYGIVGANDRLRTMFNVTGVGDVLVTFPTITAAESALT